MVAFIDQHREHYGVEPICGVLPIALSTYFLHKARQTNPTTRSPRARRDAELRAASQRIWDENEQVYGPRKVWKQLRREGRRVARCTVDRLMRAMGLRGGVRGRAWVITTRAEAAPTGRPTSSIATSSRPAPINSGSPISPTWRPGGASCTWPSSSTSSPGICGLAGLGVAAHGFRPRRPGASDL